MSKKSLLLIIISIFFIYLIYNNKYFLAIVFEYVTTSKDSVANEDSIGSIDTNKSLEDFLIEADKKRESYPIIIKKDDKEHSTIEETEKPEKKSIELFLNNQKKDEATPNKDLEQPNIETITLEEIKNFYLKDFAILESTFKSSINSLINSALSDYNSGKYSKMDIAKKYLDQGKLLEENSDKKFYILLDAMEQDLKSNKHPIDITNDIKTYYEGYKTSEKNKLVEKGMSIVKED